MWLKMGMPVGVLQTQRYRKWEKHGLHDEERLGPYSNQRGCKRKSLRSRTGWLISLTPLTDKQHVAETCPDRLDQ